MDPPPAPPTTASATRSYMEDIVQKINSNFDTVFKAMSSNAAKFNRMAAKVNQFEARLNALETEPKNVQSKKRRSTDIDNDDTVDAIVFSHLTGNVTEIWKDQNAPLASEYGVFTVAPIKKLNSGIKFAQIGLLNAVIMEENLQELSFGYMTSINTKDAEDVTFVAFSSSKPTFVKVNSKAAKFSYNQDSGVVAIHLESATTASPGTELSLQLQPPLTRGA